MNDLGGAAQVGGSHFKRDYVNALPDTMDVAGICGVPQRSDMALVGFGGEEQLKGDVGGGWWVVQEGVWLVVRGDVASQSCQVLGWGNVSVCVVM